MYKGCHFLCATNDELVKSRNLVFFVIPVKMGIQYLQYVHESWIPSYAGMTTFYEAVTNGISLFTGL